MCARYEQRSPFNYPAILRAMNTVKGRHLLVGEYDGRDTTWDEVVKIFSMSNIRAVLLSELEAVTLSAETQVLRLKRISVEDAVAAVESSFNDATKRLAAEQLSGQG